MVSVENVRPGIVRTIAVSAYLLTCVLLVNGSQRGSLLALLFMEDHAAKVVSSYASLTGTHFLKFECIYTHTQMCRHKYF